MNMLFTDFALCGPYTGQMKAVLHRVAPGIPAIDLFADAPVGNPKASANLLRLMPNGSPRKRSSFAWSIPASAERAHLLFSRLMAGGTSALGQRATIGNAAMAECQSEIGSCRRLVPIGGYKQHIRCATVKQNRKGRDQTESDRTPESVCRRFVKDGLCLSEPFPASDRVAFKGVYS
jgi:hypothetical protein